MNPNLMNPEPVNPTDQIIKTPRVDIHLGMDDFKEQLPIDVRNGMTSTPKSVPPKWFYDDHGSQLFAQITRLKEYYPTEAERTILRLHAGDIAEASGADTLVELGSGISDKSRVLLTAMYKRNQLLRYVPFDVSSGVVKQAASQLVEEYPGVDVHGIIGDFDQHLHTIPTAGTRMIALLGGTLGNYSPGPRREFLTRIAATMSLGDTFLVGTDLVKNVARLELAYNDPYGITEAFNKNVLSVMNSALDADFDLEAFDHVAFFDTTNEWIDIRLRSKVAQRVNIKALDLAVDFAAGEDLHTEISAKFRRESFAAELAEVGLTQTHWWTDPNNDYALSLYVRR